MALRERSTTDEWRPRRWRVQVEDEVGFVFSVTVTAIGEHDAWNQVHADYPDVVKRQVRPA